MRPPVGKPARHYLISPMRPCDLDAVLGIEEQCFAHSWTRDQFAEELERAGVSRCHVALPKSPVNPDPESGRPVVGFITAWLVSDELHITNLAVLPGERRRGVAAALLDRCLDQGREEGARWCQLEVRATNQAAAGLYRRFGFKSLGVRKGYYNDGEDAVVMGKDLTP